MRVVAFWPWARLSGWSGCCPVACSVLPVERCPEGSGRLARGPAGGVFVRAVRMAMPYTGRKLRGMLVDGRLTPSDVVWPLSARAALSMTVGLAWRALVPMEW